MPHFRYESNCLPGPGTTSRTWKISAKVVNHIAVIPSDLGIVWKVRGWGVLRSTRHEQTVDRDLAVRKGVAR